jgi:F-type H+-transporting ATPase subunit epsilon
VRLKVLLPSEVLLDEEVAKVVAEAENGSFALLPRHIDFVSALVPGILSYESSEGEERFLAVDGGILVKAGPEVLVSTLNAVISTSLQELRETVETQFRVLSEQETSARSALARLEMGFIRRFLELGRQGP